MIKESKKIMKIYKQRMNQKKNRNSHKNNKKILK